MTRSNSTAIESTLIPVGLVCIHALIWTIYGTVSASNGLHQDSLEAFAWGREFSLGYFKHPPLWAWIAGLWFKVLPRQDWAFYLLSELNAGLGLLGAWMLIGRFCDDRTRRAATLLLLLTPFYTFNALRFNANTILLSLWPWTMYFFVRSIEDRGFRSSILFGLFASMAMLSKYYSLLLLASCFAASLSHPSRRAYFASAAPYVAILVCELVFAAHVVWLVRDGFQPVLYAMSRTEYADNTIIESLVGFIVACCLFHVFPLGLVAAAKWMATSSPASARGGQTRHGLSFLAILAVGPFLLTLIAGELGHVRLAPPFAIPIFALVPLLLIKTVAPPVDRIVIWSQRLFGAILAVSLLTAPLVPYASLRWGDRLNNEPRTEINVEAARMWREATGLPLRIIAGSWPYAMSLVFHDTDDVSNFDGFKPRRSPWVTSTRIDREGLLVICVREDVVCLDKAALYVTPATQRFETTLTRRVWGYEGEPMTFLVLTIPPRAVGDPSLGAR